MNLGVTQTRQLVLPSTENDNSTPKLSEPRHLFSLQRELGPQQAPRWPAECQVHYFNLEKLICTRLPALLIILSV